MIFRRGRFADVVARQLDVFAEDEAHGLLEEVRDAKGVYDRAERDEAEERYGDYVDVVEAATEALADMRWQYASTLDEAAAEEYELAFNRAVRRSWAPLGLVAGPAGRSIGVDRRPSRQAVPLRHAGTDVAVARQPAVARSQRRPVQAALPPAGLGRRHRRRPQCAPDSQKRAGWR